LSQSYFLDLPWAHGLDAKDFRNSQRRVVGAATHNARHTRILRKQNYLEHRCGPRRSKQAAQRSVNTGLIERVIDEGLTALILAFLPLFPGTVLTVGERVGGACAATVPMPWMELMWNSPGVGFGWKCIAQ
jgi:hypothetical protein